MEKRWCIIYIEKPWPGWLHSDPIHVLNTPAIQIRSYKLYKACNIDRRATRATRDSALWACGAAGDSELLGTAMPRRVYHLETQSSKETSSRTGVRCP